MAARKPSKSAKSAKTPKKKAAPAKKPTVLGNDPFARGSAVREAAAQPAVAPLREQKPTPELQVAQPPAKRGKPVLEPIAAKPKSGTVKSAPSAEKPKAAAVPVAPALPLPVPSPAVVRPTPRASSPTPVSRSLVGPEVTRMSRPTAPSRPSKKSPGAEVGQSSGSGGPVAHTSPSAEVLTGPVAHTSSPSVSVDPRPHAGTPSAEVISGPVAHTSSPSVSVDPRPHAGTPSAEVISGPVAHMSSPSISVDPRPHAGTPSAEVISGPVAHAASPGVTVDPRPHAGTPSAEVISGPVAHAASPGVTVDPRPHAGTPSAEVITGPVAHAASPRASVDPRPHAGTPSAEVISGPVAHAASPRVTVDPRPHAGTPSAEVLSGPVAHGASPGAEVVGSTESSRDLPLSRTLSPGGGEGVAAARGSIRSAFRGLIGAVRSSAGLSSRAAEVDRYGKDTQLATQLRPLGDLLYDKYWRVRVEGAEHLPSGPFIIVANHAGALPLDGPVLHLALRRERPDLAESRWLLEDQIFHAPFVGVLANRLGAVRANPENALRLLGENRPLIVFPEGFHGLSKPFSERYQLRRFGRGGYVKIALRAGVPIVPAAIIGGEESMPLIAKIPGGLFGVEYLPVTLPPLPARWHIRFAEPVSLDGAPSEPEHDLAWIERKNLAVRDQIEGMLTHLLQHRENIF
jgi:1-acyl-sn-glycerol-3-phosphate acyltransferase